MSWIKGFKISPITLVLLVVLSAFPDLIRGSYETQDTIVLEPPKLADTVDNPPNSASGQKKFPWLASIMRKGKVVCAGSLIDSMHILSTAFCVQNITADEIRDLQVGVGYQTFNDDEPISTRGSEGPYYVRRVTKVIMDRSFYYQSLQMQNSLLILKLDAPVTINDYVDTIFLADNITIPKHRLTHPPPPIRTGKLAGWRKGNPVKGQDMNFLRSVTLRIYTFEECQKDNLGSKKMDEILCASSTINNPCHFMLGSPLSARRHGQNLLIGLRERDCHFPSVFTRVEHFIPWIRQNLVH